MLEVFKDDFSPETVIAIYGSTAEFGPEDGRRQLTAKTLKPKWEGRAVFELLKAAGNHIYPIATDMQKLGDDTVYASLSELPEPVDIVIDCLKKEQGLKVVNEAAAAGVKKIIFQPQTDSPEALNLCDEKGIKAIKGCALVHRTVSGITRFISPCFYMGLGARKLEVHWPKAAV